MECPERLWNYLSDNVCDDESNTKECKYDGGDCCQPEVDCSYCTECHCHKDNTGQAKCITKEDLDQVSCTSGLSKLFIAMGDSTMTETVDIENWSIRCEDQPDLLPIHPDIPEEKRFAQGFGAYFPAKDQAFLCGHWGVRFSSDDYHNYDWYRDDPDYIHGKCLVLEDQEPPVLSQMDVGSLYYTAHVVLNDTTMFFRNYGTGKSYLVSTTEDRMVSFTPGPSWILPDRHSFCMIAVPHSTTKTKIMITGGLDELFYYKISASSDTWILDLDNYVDDDDLVAGPRLRLPRSYHSCGLILDTDDRTPIFIITGGVADAKIEEFNPILEMTTELLMPGDQAWRRGPELPVQGRQLDATFYLTSSDKKHFIKGMLADQVDFRLYRMQCFRQACHWSRMRREIQYRQSSGVAAMLVPDSFAKNCTLTS